MKLTLGAFVAGSVLGILLTMKFLKPEAVVTEKVVTKDKIVTVTKTVKAKDGTVTTERTRTQDKQTNAQKAIVDRNTRFIGLHQSNDKKYGVVYSQQISGNIYAYGVYGENGYFGIGLGVGF